MEKEQRQDAAFKISTGTHGVE